MLSSLVLVSLAVNVLAVLQLMYSSYLNSIVITPSAETPFEDGTFRLVLTFEETYPNRPPTVKFL